MPTPVYAQILNTTAAQGSNTYVYIPMSNANGTVNIYDPAQKTVVATVAVAAYPIKCCVTPDGLHCYVLCATSGSSAELDCIDTTTNLVVWRTGFSNVNMVDMCISPDGQYLYVVGTTTAPAMQVREIRLADRITTADVNINTISTVYACSADKQALFISLLRGDGTSAIVYRWPISIATNAVQAFATLLNHFPAPDIGASPDGTVVSVLDASANGKYVVTYTMNGQILATTSGTATLKCLIWSADSQVLYYGDGTILYWMYIGLPADVAGQVTVGQECDGLALSSDGTQLFYIDTANGTLFPFSTFDHTVGASVSVGSNPKKPGVMPQPIDVVQTLNVVQVLPGQTWNVSLSTSTPSSGSGSYALYAGTRLIGRANVGQNIGPFTAYDGEQISLQVTGTASNFTVSIAGYAYARGETAPTVFPGISG